MPTEPDRTPPAGTPQAPGRDGSDRGVWPGDGGALQDLPDPAYGHGRQAARQQTLEMGAGPMLHRSYAVRITGSSMTPAALVDLTAERLNQVSPEMAVIRKTRGTATALRLGDEFLVRMPGPWDGPVRVVRRAPAAFRVATLDGHLEAGEIEFPAEPDGATLRFEIESWARAGDRLAALLYNRLRLAKEIQLNMWSTSASVPPLWAGGRPQGGITIRTRWAPGPSTRKMTHEHAPDARIPWA